MTPHDPTTVRGWKDAEPLDDLIVDDPLTREAGPRGVESWEITPGAPPVRRKRPPTGRSLLRDSTIQRNILKKARATPVPAPRSRRREAETSRKPDSHEHEFYKPAAPLLTNVVVDRPPPVRKDADPTWDPAPERDVAAPRVPPPPVLEPDAELDNAWFLSAEGTLEPAEQRVILPPRRIAAFLAFGAGIGAVALVAVAIGEGSAGSTAEAMAPSIETVVAAPVEPVAEPVAAEPVAAEAVTEPVVAETVAPVAVAAEPVATPKAVAHRPEPAAEPAGTSSIDRLRASMADNAFLAPEPKAAPKAAPTKTPEGSAELWGEIQTDEAPEKIWGELDE